MNKLVLGTLSVLLFSATAGLPAANAEVKDSENRTKQSRPLFHEYEMRGQQYDDFEYEEFYNSNETELYDSDESYSGSRLGDLRNNQRNYDNSTPDNGSDRVYYFRNDAETSRDNFYSDSNYDPGAFTLVSLAYRGRYEEYGIPGYLNFISSYRSGEVAAEDIVEAGIMTGELPPMALEDDGFIRAVQMQVEGLIIGR
ncbi:MAG: hypothetical protein ACLFV6_12270 [Spirulinaceae cyanobacterium]